MDDSHNGDFNNAIARGSGSVNVSMMYKDIKLERTDTPNKIKFSLPLTIDDEKYEVGDLYIKIPREIGIEGIKTVCLCGNDNEMTKLDFLTHCFIIGYEMNYVGERLSNLLKGPNIIMPLHIVAGYRDPYKDKYINSKEATCELLNVILKCMLPSFYIEVDSSVIEYCDKIEILLCAVFKK